MTRKVASKTLALINCAFERTPDCSNMVRKRAYSSSVNRTMRQFFAGSTLGGLPPFPRFGGDFFCSITSNLARRVSETLRRLKIWFRHTGCPVKSDDFGGTFLPLAGKLFCVTENISRNGKHSLLSPETYNVPGTQKRVEHSAPFPLVRRPAKRGEHRVPSMLPGTKLPRRIIGCISVTDANHCHSDANHCHRRKTLNRSSEMHLSLFRETNQY